MASTPISVPTSRPNLHDLPSEHRPNLACAQEVVDKANNTDRFIESKKSKLLKDPPRPPARVVKSEKSGEPDQFYDEAWDIRLSRLGLKKATSPTLPPPISPSSQAVPNSNFTSNNTSNTLLDGGTGGKLKPDDMNLRCPPDGAATYETSSLNSVNMVTSSEINLGDSIITQINLEDFCKPDSMSKSNSAGADSADGFSTPTQSTPWFPPPPPTPLHLSIPEPSGNPGRRYHEHGRALEDNEGGLDDLQTTDLDHSDAITLPPLSPPPPPPEGSHPPTGRSSAASYLPPPPTLIDDLLPSLPPPAIPPRDPATSLQSSKSSLTSPDSKESTQTFSDSKKTQSSRKEDSNKASQNGAPLAKTGAPELSIQRANRANQLTDTRNGRSVVPWEPSEVRASTLPGPGTDVSETLPQWVPPQHSEAIQRGNPRPRGDAKSNMVPVSVVPRHRLAKSQGSDGELMVNHTRPISLAARSNASSYRRRHTTSSFGDDLGVSPPEANMHPLLSSNPAQQQRPSHRTTLRMHSDSDASGQSNNYRMRMHLDVWSAAAPHTMDGFDSDSVSQFVRVGYDVGSVGNGHGSQKMAESRTSHHQKLSNSVSQRQPVVTQRFLSEPGMLVESGEIPESMTQSLIIPSGEDCGEWTEESQKSQQQRMCRRMRAVHLTDSDLVLSPHDYANQHRRSERVQRVLVSKGTSSSDAQIHKMKQSVWRPQDVEWCPENHSKSSELRSPQDGGMGYVLQPQISCPASYNGLQGNVGSWAEVSGTEFDPTSEMLLDYRNSQTEPGHFPGQSYMMWPPVLGNARRRRGHHPTTQPIVVDQTDGMFVGKRSTGHALKATVGQNGMSQGIISGRQRIKQRQELATLASLPIEEQPWFHGILSRVEAEALLRSAHPGSFLVRTSETSKSAFSLSIRRDRDYLHMKISFDPKTDAYILGEYSQPYPTVPIMVHHYAQNLLPVRGTKPVLLRYPICRSLSQFPLQTP